MNGHPASPWSQQVFDDLRAHAEQLDQEILEKQQSMEAIATDKRRLEGDVERLLKRKRELEAESSEPRLTQGNSQDHPASAAVDDELL